MKHEFCSALEGSKGGGEMDDWSGNPQAPVESHLCSPGLFPETPVGASWQLCHLESVRCPSPAAARYTAAGMGGHAALQSRERPQVL